MASQAGDWLWNATHLLITACVLGPLFILCIVYRGIFQDVVESHVACSQNYAKSYSFSWARNHRHSRAPLTQAERWGGFSTKIRRNELTLTMLRSPPQKTRNPLLQVKYESCSEAASLEKLRVDFRSFSFVASLCISSETCQRRKWQPTPVFLPGGSQGQRGLVGCRLWGRTELDRTEAT